MNLNGELMKPITNFSISHSHSFWFDDTIMRNFSKHGVSTLINKMEYELTMIAQQYHNFTSASQPSLFLSPKLFDTSTLTMSYTPPPAYKRARRFETDVAPPVVVTPQQQAMADASGIGRPTIDQYFEDAVNPYTNENFRVTARRAVDLIVDVISTQPCPKAMDSDLIKSDLTGYRQSVTEGVIAIACLRGGFGYNKKLRATCKSCNVIIQNYPDAENPKRAHFE